MMGLEIPALMGLFGITSVFALVGLVLAGWMAWRIVAKAGLPGWAGLGAILLTLTAVGTIVPLVLLWVFAFMRWPRDEPQQALGYATASGGATVPPQVLPPPAMALADRRLWRLTGALPGGGALALAVDAAPGTYVVTGSPAAGAAELSVPDPSLGRPHARVLVAAGRLGLEDLGTPGGTFIDGARLLPEHGPRDISAARSIRFGAVEFALSRA